VDFPLFAGTIACGFFSGRRIGTMTDRYLGYLGRQTKEDSEIDVFDI
jgi:hypothetical protein